MSDLTGEFCCLQDDFLAAVIEGDGAMADFATRISDLLDRTHVNAGHHTLSEGCDRDMVHNITFGVATLATSFIELESESEKISSTMVSEIEGIFSCLSLGGSYVNQRSTAQESPAGGSSKMREPCQWLLNNIHNPYPSIATRRSLAKSSGLSLKILSDWFSQTRRRIGWTSLSKRCFKGDRQLTVDCASRIYAKDNGGSVYPSHLAQEFFNMRDRAQSLILKIIARSQPTAESDSGSMRGVMVGREDEILHSGSVEEERIERARNVSSSLGEAIGDLEKVSGRKRCRPTTENNHDPATDLVRLSKRRRSSVSVKHSPLSRTASMSTASRASTSELLTPTTSICELPLASTEKSINDWLSEIPIDLFDPMYWNGQHENLVRTSSESTTNEPQKGSAEIQESRFLVPQSVCDGTPLVKEADGFNEDMLNIISHLDFSLPPPASINVNFFQEGPLQVNGWGAFGNESSGETNYVSNPSIYEMPRPARKRRLSDTDSGGRTKPCRTLSEGTSSSPISCGTTLHPPSDASAAFSNNTQITNAHLEPVNCCDEDQTRARQYISPFEPTGLMKPLWKHELREKELAQPLFGVHVVLGVSESFPDPPLPAGFDTEWESSLHMPIAQSDVSTGARRSPANSAAQTLVSANAYPLETEKITKLNRIDQLLSEAAKLQQEVFG